MDRILNFAKALVALPTEELVLLVALGALALAAFAIYVVHAHTQERRHHD
jgi:hypothetical protein